MLETKRIEDDIEVDEVQACDYCGSRAFKVWDKSRLNTLTKCLQCGLIFTNPRIKRASEKDGVLYSKNYFNQQSRMTGQLMKARRKTYKREIDVLLKYAKCGRILDVGCGEGNFLSCFNGTWDKVGIDVSSYALEKASKRGIKVYHGEFENVHLTEDKFDVIYFRASLHHVFSPSVCLQRAYNLLEDDGVLAICMNNNVSGVAGRLFRGRVKSYEQAHNYLFTRATLVNYLVKYNFTIKELEYPYWDTGYGSVHGALNIVPKYIQYIWLRCTRKLEDDQFLNFSSPAFYGNYLNVWSTK